MAERDTPLGLGLALVAGGALWLLWQQGKERPPGSPGGPATPLFHLAAAPQFFVSSDDREVPEIFQPALHASASFVVGSA